MANWLWMVCSSTMAVQGVVMLLNAIADRSKQAQSLVLVDLGQTPWSIGRVCGEMWLPIGFGTVCWTCFENRPFWEGLSISVFFACLLATSWMDSTQRRCLLEQGMRVTTRTLWMRDQRFIPWSDVKQYQWNGTTLIVNPGWNQVSCLIPEVCVEEVNTIMMRMCPQEAASAMS